MYCHQVNLYIHLFHFGPNQSQRFEVNFHLLDNFFNIVQISPVRKMSPTVMVVKVRIYDEGAGGALQAGRVEHEAFADKVDQLRVDQLVVALFEIRFKRLLDGWNTDSFVVRLKQDRTWAWAEVSADFRF